MKLKTYETPQVDLLLVNTELNFCVSGDLPEMIVDDYIPDWIF